MGNTGTQDTPTGVQTITPGVNLTNTGSAQNPILNAVELDPSIPTGFFASTISRDVAVSSNLTPLTSGELSWFKIVMVAGAVVSKIAFQSGTTGATTPTHQWFGLLDQNLNALCATVDNTNVAWAANTQKSLAIGFAYNAGWGAAASFTLTYSGIYYMLCMVAAATPPPLEGASVNGGISQLAPAVNGSDTTHTGLTTPTTCPAAATNSGGNPGGMAYGLAG